MVFAVVLGLIVVFLALVMTRGLPDIEPQVTYQAPGEPMVIAGITQGQAALGSTTEVKATYGEADSKPIASMAKVITALVVLEKTDDLNQVITMDGADVEFYRQTARIGGSRLQVVEGEQLTLKQMLEALLMVSANNIADSLVHHVFGSQEKYVAAATEWLVRYDLVDTQIGADASGLDAGTTSTPPDMIKLGQLALGNSVVSQIVAQKTATFPLENEVDNTNELLKDGYFGIKTGNSDEAFSCLLFATEVRGEMVIGVLMGQPFNSTFNTARSLRSQVEDNLAEIRIPAGTTVGKYVLPWGGEVNITTEVDVVATTWGGTQPDITIANFRFQNYGNEVGIFEFGRQITDLEVKETVAKPDLFWRLNNLNQLKW